MEVVQRDNLASIFGTTSLLVDDYSILFLFCLFCCVYVLLSVYSMCNLFIALFYTKKIESLLFYLIVSFLLQSICQDSTMNGDCTCKLYIFNSAETTVFTRSDAAAIIYFIHQFCAASIREW